MRYAAVCLFLLGACSATVDPAPAASSDDEDTTALDPMLTDAEDADDTNVFDTEAPDPDELAVVDDEPDDDSPYDTTGVVVAESARVPCGRQHLEVAVEDDNAFLGPDEAMRALAFAKTEALVGPHAVIRADVYWGKTVDKAGNLRSGVFTPDSAFVHFVKQATGQMPDADGVTHHFDVELTLTGTAAPRFGHGPPSYYGCAPEADGSYAPDCGGGIIMSDVGKHAAAFGDFVATTVGALAPLGVHRFALWNEPNGPAFLSTGGHNGSVYVQLYRAGYARAVHAYAKQCVRRGDGKCAAKLTLLLGELSSSDHRGPHYRLKFVEAMAAYIKHGHPALRTSGMAVHPYQHSAPPDEDDPSKPYGIHHVGDIRHELARMAHKHILKTPSGGQAPLFLTEFGYFRLTDGCPSCWAGNLCKNPHRAEWTRRAFELATAGGARQMLWYLLFTDANCGAWDTSLLHRNGAPFCDDGTGAPVSPCQYTALQQWVSASCHGGAGCRGGACAHASGANQPACSAATDCMVAAKWDESALDGCVAEASPDYQALAMSVAVCVYRACTEQPGTDAFASCAAGAVAAGGTCGDLFAECQAAQ